MSEVESKLRVVLRSIAEDGFPGANIKIKPTSSNAANYCSILYDATISTPEEEIEVFAKVMAMGGGLSTTSRLIFHTESFVYTTLSRAFKKILDQHGLDDQWFVFARHYVSREIDGVQIIALENLVHKGYNCYDRLKSIDWKYASKCVETLSRYHALSLAFSKQYPEEFKKAEKVLKFPEFAGPKWEGLTDAALAVVEEQDRPILSRLLEGSEGWSKSKDFTDPCRTKMIVHADYRPSNLMHKEVDGKLQVIPVDYQGVRIGCPAADLIYFIVLGSDQQFRQQHFHQLVDHYYQQLALAMKKLGLEPEEEYGREEFDSDFKEKLPLGLCVAAMVLPFVTVDAAHAPCFEDGRFVPRASELFAERFRGLMQDFKLWGFI